MFFFSDVRNIHIGVFWKGKEVAVDPEDGFLLGSELFRPGDELTVRLRSTVADHFLYLRPQKQPGSDTWAIQATQVPDGIERQKEFHFRIPVVQKKNRCTTPRFPQNRFVLMLAKSTKGQLIPIPRCLEIAIISQRGDFFLFVDDFINTRQFEEELDFRRMMDGRLKPEEREDPTKDPETLWKMIEDNGGLVMQYSPIHGEGRVLLPDDTSALVRWTSIRTDQRFVRLKKGDIIQFAEKAPLETPRQGIEWRLKKVVVLIPEEEGGPKEEGSPSER